MGEEEEVLKAELRKIEARKREREKKTADLQKMIAQADASSGDSKKLGKKQKSVTVGGRLARPEPTQVETTGIRWPDGRASGVSLRSASLADGALAAANADKDKKKLSDVID